MRRSFGVANVCGRRGTPPSARFPPIFHNKNNGNTIDFDMELDCTLCYGDRKHLSHKQMLLSKTIHKNLCHGLNSFVGIAEYL